MRMAEKRIIDEVVLRHGRSAGIVGYRRLMVRCAATVEYRDTYGAFPIST